MRVRIFWPKCESRESSWHADSVDAYWVEATREEAEKEVFPRLTPEKQAVSLAYGEEGAEVAKDVGSPALPFCFLVAKDLNSIDPHPTFYPFSGLWNADSPFREVPEFAIRSLDELKVRFCEDET